MVDISLKTASHDGLNESPSKKEGKFPGASLIPGSSCASMKALPKRKGNALLRARSSLLPVGPQ